MLSEFLLQSIKHMANAAVYANDNHDDGGVGCRSILKYKNKSSIYRNKGNMEYGHLANGPLACVNGYYLFMI